MNKKALALLVAVCFAGCSGSKDVYHVRSQAWVGDSIEVAVYETASPTATQVSPPKITIYCRSCNLIDAPRELTFDAQGTAHVYMPETLYELEPRLHLLGKGIDTTIILHTAPPAVDQQRFKLGLPLVGRIMLLEESPLYASSDQDSTVTSARTGDQMNIFGEDQHFYLVHHPMFSAPLFLLKTNAARLF